MEKPFLTWELVFQPNFPEDFECFCLCEELILLGTSKGKVQILNICEVSLLEETIHSIFNIKPNVFGICQSHFTMLEITNTYKILGTFKTKITGFCDGYFWTKICVLSQDFKELYTIDEKDIEIVQVSSIKSGFIVSTYIRSVIVYKDKNVQIGKKERNGFYGACEYSGSVYASRPLGNLWQANGEGVVMITTSYKIKSEKIVLGSLNRIDKFLLSMKKGNDGMILLDPVNKTIIYSEEVPQKGRFHYNHQEHIIYKYTSQGFYKSKIISCYEHFLHLLSRPENVDSCLTFTLENPELHNLDLLQDLCVLVFANDFNVNLELFKRFSELIEKLEENMRFPRIEVKNVEYKRDDLFDEFLKASSLAKKPKPRVVKIKIDKRILAYYRKNLTWVLLVNWLLFVIWKKNLALDKVSRFAGVAERSLDFYKFRILSQEKNALVREIESVL